MTKGVAGAFRLFTAFGVSVYLHWTWFVLAALYVHFNSTRSSLFSQPAWHLVVLLALFGIVTLHEFGHALACRSVGGRADTIVLWPLGGIAFVRPPDRPGAVLWSIAAGPLVNVALVPVTLLLSLIVGLGTLDPLAAGGDLRSLVALITLINIVLLIFNMLPIYPLDGGQVLHALLWFMLGKARSLLVVAYIGMGGAALLGLGALMIWDLFLVLVALFIGWQAFNGLQMARALAAAELREPWNRE